MIRNYMKEFKRTIMTLASKPGIQDKLFPDFSCKGDEMILEFNEAYQRIKNESTLSKVQREEFEILDEFIEKHSGKNFEKLYTNNQAIFSEPFWSEIRSLAKNIITVMNWTYEEPKPSGAIYIGESK